MIKVCELMIKMHNKEYNYCLTVLFCFMYQLTRQRRENLPYYLKLCLVSYKCLVMFSSGGNSIIAKINAGCRLNTGSFVDP